MLGFCSLAHSSEGKLDNEKIRWMLPFDLWSEARALELKKFVKFKNLGTLKFFFYDPMNNTKSPVLSYEKLKVMLGDNSRCELGDTPKVKTITPNLKCGYHFCDNVAGLKVIERDPLFPKKDFYNPSTKKRCDLPFFMSSYDVENNVLGDDYHYLYLPYESYDSVKKNVTINWNGKNLILDMKECGVDCQLKEKDMSAWERSLARMRRHIKEKDLNVLNHLIEHLLPCVKKRDRECVQKFLLQKELDPESPSYIYGDWTRGGGEVQDLVTESFMKNLEECLKYESVLPHLKALKGIDRVCIPFGGLMDEDHSSSSPYFKIDHITFPEAVRTMQTRDFYFMRVLNE